MSRSYRLTSIFIDEGLSRWQKVVAGAEMPLQRAPASSRGGRERLGVVAGGTPTGSISEPGKQVTGVEPIHPWSLGIPQCRPSVYLIKTIVTSISISNYIYV